MKNILSSNTMLITVLFLSSLSIFTLLSVEAAGAQNLKEDLCTGSSGLALPKASTDPNAPSRCADVNGDGAVSDEERDNNAESRLEKLIGTIVNIFTVIVGIVAVIMIIVGGFKFITSGGDSGKVTSARQTVIYALIGLIIVALAQIIVRFVLSKV